MVYGCGASTVKCLVFTFNLLAFIAGLGILITAAVFYTNPGIAHNALQEILKNADSLQSIKSVLIGGMVIGAFICLLGFLGCCGALMESGAMLCLFGTVMVIMLIAQVAIGITVLVAKGKVKDEVGNILEQEAVKAKDGHDSNTTECNFYLDLAKQGICCGYNSSLPFQIPNTKCSYTCEGDVATKFCKDEVWKLLEYGAKAMGIVALVFIVMELAATIFGCCLWTAIRRGERLYEYA